MHWYTVHERRLRLTFTVTTLLEGFVKLTLVIDRKEEINRVPVDFYLVVIIPSLILIYIDRLTC